MFTGIIRHTGKITSTKSMGNSKRLTLIASDEILSKMEKGITSIAINGSCHTVEDIKSDSFAVYSSFETLKRTTIGELKSGSMVNLELPLTPQSLLDGHIVQGHIDGIGRIVSFKKEGEAYLYIFIASSEIVQYLVEKDSIAVDGISLTLFDIKGQNFSVAVIPETIANTALGDRKVGSRVNLEVNIFAKYARHFSGTGRAIAKDEKLKKWLSS